MSEKDSDDEGPPDLEWRDYIAIGIAALETVLLPLVILLAIMIALYVIIR